MEFYKIVSEFIHCKDLIDVIDGYTFNTIALDKIIECTCNFQTLDTYFKHYQQNQDKQQESDTPISIIFRPLSDDDDIPLASVATHFPKHIQKVLFFMKFYGCDGAWEHYSMVMIGICNNYYFAYTYYYDEYYDSTTSYSKLYVGKTLSSPLSKTQYVEEYYEFQNNADTLSMINYLG